MVDDDEVEEEVLVGGVSTETEVTEAEETEGRDAVEFGEEAEIAAAEAEPLAIAGADEESGRARRIWKTFFRSLHQQGNVNQSALSRATATKLPVKGEEIVWLHRQGVEVIFR